MLNNDINVELINNLTINTVQMMRDSLLSRIKNNQHKTVTIDLSGLGNFDTSGLALLIDIKKQCNQHSKNLRFINVPQKITDLANFYGVEEILNKGLQ
jgi:phospholipid transport system transporter-binding protein